MLRRNSIRALELSLSFALLILRRMTSSSVSGRKMSVRMLEAFESLRKVLGRLYWDIWLSISSSSFEWMEVSREPPRLLSRWELSSTTMTVSLCTRIPPMFSEDMMTNVLDNY